MELRKYINALDDYQPKNSYCFGVSYIPRYAVIDDAHKSIADIEIFPDLISENFLTFLSMLG
jgi:hypothetical protein